MKTRIRIFQFFILFFLVTLTACAAETALDMSKKELLSRLKEGDIKFIIEAQPSRMTELSRIDAALPFYAALLVAEQDAGNERTALLFQEALKSPAAHDAAMKKLTASNPEYAVFGESVSSGSGSSGNIAAGQIAIARRDYNEAMRQFQLALNGNEEVFLSDKELLGDLGKAFQYSSIPRRGAPPRAGIDLFLMWEKELREGNRLWTLSPVDRDERRYLLMYYAARMKRALAEYDESEALFVSALALAPNNEQSDACIWYIISLSMEKNAGKKEKTTELIKKYSPFMSNPSYFSDIFEKFTHELCLNQNWDDIAELFPYIRRFGTPELYAKYAFILGNLVELNFLTLEKSKSALELPFMEISDTPIKPEPDDFYKLAYDSDVITGSDTATFYYIAAAAEKLGKKPRINIPENKKNNTAKLPAVNAGGNELTKKFLDGFFLFGASRLAYPYIIENAEILSIPELRALAKALAGAERWGESIRLARIYMGRPDYEPSLDDLRICYPLAFSEIVKEYSRKTGMDEALLYGLIRTESLFIPDIVSHAGAVGLAQLMPETAREMARQLARNGGPDYFMDGSLDLSDPIVNVHLGTLYFQQLKQRMNGTLLALLSYNGGVNRIRRWRGARPALNDALFLESVDYTETREYGRQVLAAAAIYDCLSKLKS
ncbi:MAG: lytic transglycosylase domain-containing protein [Treponema sp.]|jgi:soluble lytic murein transglycosylase|nr:lytic transglycosylase domain-containing protein [Treponema sp.]